MPTLYMRMLLLILCGTVGPCSGQENLYTTGGMFNGRMWLQFDDAARSAYVLGVRDGISLGVAQFSQAPNYSEVQQRFFAKIVIQEMVDEISALYKDRENTRIPLSLAFDYCTKKLRGTSTKADLERELIRLRTLAAQL